MHRAEAGLLDELGPVSEVGGQLLVSVIVTRSVLG
jgi:hypothetical protein